MRPQELDDALCLRLAGKNRVRLEPTDNHVDYLTINCERRLTLAQATKRTDRMPIAAPITGWRRMFIKLKLWTQYRAEVKAAGVAK